MKARGHVYLVGAGPGDPDLLTIKAARLIKSADVIVHDRLVSPQILALADPGAHLIDVGKSPGRHPIPQPEIERLLVGLAESARVIVRLKGGDPFIFGRGGEELLHLISHGVTAEVVPGVTSAQGCAARVGLPLTHRGMASSVRYVTGHFRDSADADYDWNSLADPETTLVVYMGRANIAHIAEQLMAHGLSPYTPVAAISNGTRADERRTVAHLDSIAEAVEAEHLSGPVLFIIGDVVRLISSCEEGAFAHLDHVLAGHA